MRIFLASLAFAASIALPCVAATITIDGKTVGPGTAKMTVDGLSAGQSSQYGSIRTSVTYADGRTVTTYTNGATTTTYGNGASTTTTYGDGTTTRVYRNGYITKIYRNGVLTAVYQDGSVVDWTYYGSLINVKKSLNFDLRNELHALHSGKFSEYFNAFLNNYKINEMGRFMPATNARTPANQYTRDEFKHFVAEATPHLVIESIDRCVLCSGSGHHTSLVNNVFVEVRCENCNGRGHISNTLTVALTNTAKLPPRPTLENFASVGMLTLQAPAPQAMTVGGLIELGRVVPPDEVPKPVASVVTPKPALERIELTPLQRFQMTKGQAEAGNSQAQYELALFYLQEHEKPVPLDYFEAQRWMLKAAMKNHRMAQFHLGRLFENGLGTPINLESSVQWRRSAALLGCKQSQKWMGQLYSESASSNSKYASIIKEDPANLIEAYAWYSLGSEVPFPPRLENTTPGSEELASGEIPLNVRDYSFEQGIPESSARERDIIARNPQLTKQMYDDAKARCLALKKESEDHCVQNRPK